MTFPIRHFTRAVFFAPPQRVADLANAMADQFAAMPPGKILVYHLGASGGASAAVRDAAFAVASRIAGAALVQWPTRGVDDAGRQWCYGIQKAGAK